MSFPHWASRSSIISRNPIAAPVTHGNAFWWRHRRHHPPSPPSASTAAAAANAAGHYRKKNSGSTESLNRRGRGSHGLRQHTRYQELDFGHRHVSPHRRGRGQWSRVQGACASAGGGWLGSSWESEREREREQSHRLSSASTWPSRCLFAATYERVPVFATPTHGDGDEGKSLAVSCRHFMSPQVIGCNAEWL
jgi:hypothetical protein